LLLALIAGNPAFAEDRYAHTILGQKLTVTVDGHNVIGDLHGLAITVFGRDSKCARDYYLVAATSTMGAGRPLSLDACDVQLCTTPELKATCKGQPEMRSVPCTGTIEIEGGTRVRLEVNYNVEVWKLPVCTKDRDESVSKVIMLNFPGQAPAKQTLPSKQDVINCAAHAYLPGDHPLHGEGCN